MEAADDLAAVAVDLGRESDKLPMEKAFLGAVALRGALPAAERPWPRADPTRSPKRLGFLSGIPRRVEVGAAEAQLLPKMSPAMEGGGLARPDLGAAEAAAVGWWVHEGLPGWWVHEAAGRGAAAGAGEGLGFWSRRGREAELRPAARPKSNW